MQERLEKSYERSPPAIKEGEVDPALVLRALQVRCSHVWAHRCIKAFFCMSLRLKLCKDC